MKRPRLKSTEIKKGVTCGPGDSQIDSDLKTLKCIEILKLMLQNQKCIQLKRPMLKYPPIDWNKKGVTCGTDDSQIDSDLKTLKCIEVLKSMLQNQKQGVHFIYQLLLFPFHLLSLNLFLLLCFIVGIQSPWWKFWA